MFLLFLFRLRSSMIWKTGSLIFVPSKDFTQDQYSQFTYLVTSHSVVYHLPRRLIKKLKKKSLLTLIKEEAFRANGKQCCKICIYWFWRFYGNCTDLGISVVGRYPLGGPYLG